MGKVFTTKDQREVIIDVNDHSMSVYVTTLDGSKIGEMRFNMIEGGPGYRDVLYLTHAHLEGAGRAYLGVGIGEECLKRMIEATGMEISAAENDGLGKDDGSHLTGDAPGWVARMRTKSLILPSPEDYKSEA